VEGPTQGQPGVEMIRTGLCQGEITRGQLLPLTAEWETLATNLCGFAAV
jgi:hypothetical protein